jgi:hypothetical protein
MVRSLRAACAPVPDSGQSSSTTPQAASTRRAASLSAVASVLVSTTSRPLGNCGAMAAMASADASKACALGSELITTCTACARACASAAGRPPAAFSALRAAGRGSKPCTSKPAFSRLPAIAEPMMPRPSRPTHCSGAAGCRSLRAVGDGAATALPAARRVPRGAGRSAADRGLREVAVGMGSPAASAPLDSNLLIN